MSTRRVWAGLLGLAVTIATPALAGDYHKTPLRYRNQNPIYLQFTNLTPMPVAPLPQGAGEWGATASYSNIFERFVNTNTDVRLDMELLRTTFDVAYGLGNDFTFELELPTLHSGPGFLDPFIQWYHNLFNFPNSGRNLVSNNAFGYHVQDRPTGTAHLQSGTTRIGLGDTTLRLRHRVVEGRGWKPSLGWFVQCEAPTGSRTKGLGNGALDYGLGVLASLKSTRWYGFLNLGWLVFGGHDTLDPFMHNQALSYAVGGGYHLSRRISLLTQIHGGTAQLHGLGNIQWDDFPLDLIIGLSGDYPRLIGNNDLYWQLGFSEDINPNGPSIDFTALLRIGMRWPAL